ncbi:MAG: AAA family ATPase [Myxococcales bacterium]|nr:AAA family ATPase [Myxococcales bacterium]
MTKGPMKFNPAFLAESELVANFVAREHELAQLLEIVRENTGASNQHVLLLGPRGYGKTTLVLRLAAAIRDDPSLESRWYPIVFSEEVEVASPGELWTEALFFLGKQTGEERWHETYRRLRQSHEDEELRVLALAELRAFAEREGKRLLLAVENLQVLFSDQLSSNDAWTVRHSLQSEPWLMLVTTATARFDAIEDPNQALYELFQVIELGALSARECAHLFSRLGDVEIDPLRGRALQILTGGNPRLLVVLSRFTNGAPLDSLVDDFVRLVDDHSDYFKSNIDALPFAERRVFTALAERWVPSTAREIAELARLDVNKTSALLARLEQRGAVTARAHSPRRKRYQLSERLYNLYWLLRRHGQASDRVRFVVEFIGAYYDSEALSTACSAFAAQATGRQPKARELYVHTVLQLLDRLAGNERARVLRDLGHFLSLPEVPSTERERLVEEREQILASSDPEFPAHPETEAFFAGVANFIRSRPVIARIVQQLFGDPSVSEHWATFVGLMRGSVQDDGNVGVRLWPALLAQWERSADELWGIVAEVGASTDSTVSEIVVAYALAFELRGDDDESDAVVLGLGRKLMRCCPGSPWPRLLHLSVSFHLGFLEDEEYIRLASHLCERHSGSFLLPMAFATIIWLEGEEDAVKLFVQRGLTSDAAQRVASALVDIRDDLLGHEQEIFLDPRFRGLGALTNDDLWEDALVFLARITHNYLDDAPAALAILRLAAEELPHSARIYLLQAHMAPLCGSPAEGAEAFRRAAQLRTDSYPVLLALGVQMAFLQDTSRARELVLRSWHLFTEESEDTPDGRARIVAWLRGAAEDLPEVNLLMPLADAVDPRTGDVIGPMLDMVRSGEATILRDLLIFCDIAIATSRLDEMLAALRASPRAPRLEPLFVALARYQGDQTPAPAEIEEVASDILDHLRLAHELTTTIWRSATGS